MKAKDAKSSLTSTSPL